MIITYGVGMMLEAAAIGVALVVDIVLEVVNHVAIQEKVVDDLVQLEFGQFCLLKKGKTPIIACTKMRSTRQWLRGAEGREDGGASRFALRKRCQCQTELKLDFKIVNSGLKLLHIKIPSYEKIMRNPHTDYELKNMTYKGY